MTELHTLGRVRLVTGDGAELGGAQPKRIALLAYLAFVTADAPIRRDALLALFWPELGEDDGRRALRQALYYLRRAIGNDPVLSVGDEVSLREPAVQCDAAAFVQLVAAGRFTDALALYHGDFLGGFHVDDVAPEYEEWVARTRSRRRRRAPGAAWAAADAEMSAGEPGRAIDLGCRACELEPDQESGWRQLMQLQDEIGDREGALHTYEALANRLERELDAKPSPETAALAERIRSAQRSGIGAVMPDPRDLGPRRERDVPARQVAEGARPTLRRWRWAFVAGVAGVLTVAGGLGAYIRTIPSC